MALDVAGLVQKMVSAALPKLAAGGENAASYAETEFKKIGDTMASIERDRLANRIDDNTARLLLDMQKNSTRAVLLTIEGLGILAVEAAINAAMAVVKDGVNGALGWALL